MFTFKRFLNLFEQVKFKSLSHSEWWKYGDDRLNKLIDIIRKGEPVSSKDGEDLIISNSDENIKSIKDYIKAGPDGPSKTFKLQTAKGEILSNAIGKTHAFGGKGQGGGATGDTRKGESLQCLYLEAILGEGINQPFEHYTPKTLEKYADKIFVDATIQEMLTAEDQWHFSGYTSGKHLIKKGYVKKGHAFHRGSSVMKKIYEMKKTAFKNEGKPILNDDKWNPGDIWAVKRGLDVSRALDPSTVTTLNQSLIKNFDSRDIVGISLKIVSNFKKQAKDTVYNREKVEEEKIKFTDYKLKKDRAQATFWSGKGGVVVFNGNVKADVRASTNFAAPNFEILGKGARGGRAGYGAILYGAQKFLRTKLPTNAEYKSEANQIVREVKGKKSKTLQNKFYNMVKSTDSRISRQEFDEGIVRATPDRMHINLAATYIGNAISKSSKNQRDQFMTYMINLAGAKGSDASVYVKVEES